ncbi:MAG: hypothetical protein V1674_01935 [Candidatus Omnitrophota bacterium]
MKRIIIFCLLSVVFNVTAYCGQLSRIELTDGSVINGEIISYASGVYAISTAAFGEIKIEAANVSKIESLNSSLPGNAINSSVGRENPAQSQIQSYGETLMSNPENAAIITGLAADPRIQELAKDPEIQEAVKAGDIQALMKNEKFMDIVNNFRIQEAIKKLKQ